MKSFTTDSFEFIDFTEMDDTLIRQVWECRNLPEVRKWMVNPEYIPYESHLQFIRSLNSKGDTKYYAANLNGDLIGSVNVHIGNDGSAERGIYIHPEYWGKGLAKKICREFYSYLRSNMGINAITTKVLKENIGSNSLERSLGASKISEDESLNYYYCDIRDY